MIALCAGILHIGFLKNDLCRKSCSISIVCHHLPDVLYHTCFTFALACIPSLASAVNPQRYSNSNRSQPRLAFRLLYFSISARAHRLPFHLNTDRRSFRDCTGLLSRKRKRSPVLPPSPQNWQAASVAVSPPTGEVCSIECLAAARTTPRPLTTTIRSPTSLLHLAQVPAHPKQCQPSQALPIRPRAARSEVAMAALRTETMLEARLRRSAEVAA